MHFFALILGQLMIAIGVVGSKYLLTVMPELELILLRIVVASLIILFFYVLRPKNWQRDKAALKALSRKDWCMIVLQALCAGTFFYIFLLIGLKYTSANEAGIVTSALPALIALLAFIFLRERFGLVEILSIVLAVAGLVVINLDNLHGHNTMQLVGDVLVFFALVPEASYYLLAKTYRFDLSLQMKSFLMNALNIPVVLFLLLISHTHVIRVPSGFALALLMLIGLTSALFYLFWCYGCEAISAGATAIASATMPISTIIIAWLFLGEGMDRLQFMGLVCVVSSVLCYALKRR